MLAAQTFDHVGADGIACLRLLAGGQFEFAEENIAKLFGRVDVELVSDRVVNLFFEGVNLLANFVSSSAQEVGIKGYAVHFHLEQHGQAVAARCCCRGLADCACAILP